MVEVDYDKMKVNLDCSQTYHASCLIVTDHLIYKITLLPSH